MEKVVLSDIRILVASSEEIIRNFLKIELQNYGYQILIAKDGIEALYMINTLNMTEAPLDLYLIDSSLSKLNYIKLIDRIKEVNILKPIILMVNEPNPQIDSFKQKNPVIGVLKKPFFKKELLKKIVTTLDN